MRKNYYINNIDRKNLVKIQKNIRPIKEGFIEESNFDVNQFRNFIKNLGYNIDIKEKNYKLGYKYYTSDCRSAWNTSNDEKKLLVNFNYEVALLYDEYLEKHCCHKFKYAHKKNTYYDALHNNEDWVKGHTSAFLNIQQISNKCFGTTIKDNSNILWFDIDQHCDLFNKDEQAVNRFYKILDLLKIKFEDILYIEQNLINNGIHFMVKVPFRLSGDKFFKKIENKLKENNINNVDVNFHNRIMRFPLSFEYMPVKSFNNNEPIFYNSFEEVMNINFDKTSYSDELYYMFFENKRNAFDKIKQNRNETNKKYWSKKNTIIATKFISPTLSDKIKLKAHDRFNNMGKIISHYASLQYSDSQIADEILKRNESSRDLAKWSYNELINNIHPFAEKCRNNPTKFYYHSNDLLSNQKFIPQSILECFDNKLFVKHITRLFMSYYQQERRKHSSSFTFSDSKKKNLLKQIPFILKEVIGTYIYQYNNIDDKLSRYVNTNFKKFNGFQLSDTHFKHIISESTNLDLFDKKNSSLSVQYTKKAILKILCLNEINLNKKRNWCNGFCKSYQLTETMMFKIVGNLFKAICGNDIITNKTYNNIYRTCILLKENQLVSNFLKFFNENDDKKIILEAPPD